MSLISSALSGAAPLASAADARCTPAPLGTTELYVRGTMNNWGAMDDYAFQYQCDAYYLNIDLKGRHEFKVADAAWTDATTFGNGSHTVNHVMVFDGEHTLRLQVTGAGKPATLTLGPRSFVDPHAAPITNPVALSLRFDSRNAAHKKPFGAAPKGSQIDFSVTALPGVSKVTLVIERRRLEGNQEVLEYTEAQRVPLKRGASTKAGEERFTASHRFDEIGVWGYWFDVEIDGRHYALQNNRDTIHWTRERGSMGAATVERQPEALRRVRRFRQTIHAADFKVPEWAADVVWYYIFPERFRNGDKRNDPQPGVARYQNKAVEKHPSWIGKPYVPGSGDGSDDTYNNDFFGGDLEGIIQKLDYIRELGANTIYMTPVFRAASNHKYDTADYHQIDPAFGSNADFERLCAEAAKRGIRVVPDTSLNHVGSDSVYFNRFGNFPAGGAFDGARANTASRWADWFSLDPSQANPDLQYKGWVGVKDLPEINKQSPDFRKFAYGAKTGLMQTWLDRGASGWRMDVAPWVPDDFWREWRAAIKAHKPDALTVAETWFDSSKYFLGDSFDSTMNYIFRNALLEWANGGESRALVANLELMREAYPPQAFHALMNLLSSHDQARSVHHFGWHQDNDDAAVVRTAKQKQSLAWLFQMSYPGAPTIYYGDEVGLAGGDDPDNRRPYPWADEGGQPDLALLAQMKQLTTMRHAHPVLRRGTLLAPLQVGTHTLVLGRQLGKDWAITAFNNADHAIDVQVDVPAGAPQAWKDALGGAAVKARNGQLTLTLPARFGVVLTGR
ncbi:glycoside hydrolase family 13 protein [Ideonella margarita]|uniref:Alpha-amylase family glycosyl hydrolase n=1 Tax=Ideonella margarita TaxID=2984191 RepID=A0ABU9C8M9_9BURK